MKDDFPPKKEQKDSKNKSEQNPNLTSSPSAPKDFSHMNNLSPDKNSNFPSKENYFGVKASPTRGMGRTSSSGAHSPIFNYYSISSDGKEYCSSPKEGINQSSINSNKVSPSNYFNYSPTNIFNTNKNNNQSNEEEKTLQEKMENLVDVHNFMGRKYSFPSNGSNPPESKNGEEEEEENEERLTLSIDSGGENIFTETNKILNLQNLEEQEKKINKGNNNNINLQNKKENQNDKNISVEPIKKDDDNTEKKIHTIYDNIKKSNTDNNQINDNIYNNNLMNNININDPKQNIMNNIVDKNNINNFNFYNMNNIQNPNLQPKQEGSLVQNIINKQEFKPYIPNKLRNQFQEQEIPNYYYNNMNMNMNMNYGLKNNKNYSEDMNMNIPYNNYEKNNLMKNRNNNFINNMNNLNNNFNNNYYMNNNNNIYKNQYYLNNNIQNNYPNYPNINQFHQNNNFIPQMQLQMPNTGNYMPEPENNNNSINNFIYKGDKYQINNTKEVNKNDKGEIRSISEADIVTAITANNKVIKRIDPNTYLTASIEYLSYNILPLAKDQAGCRFLQEKLEQDPNAANAFYKAILPHIINLVKDPFGNYLIQKLCNYLDEEGIKKIIEIISPNILDIGSNSHGTRVIQYLVNFLKTKELVDYFMSVLKPHVISLLKELNGTHIINKLITDHQECASEINRIIIENSAALATHRHGCCILQRLLDRPDEQFRNDLIANLVENCFVLIIDQFGNYVIQSILLSNNTKAAGAIALKICDNIQYYSKHRYSSNVIEKCFDHCGKREQKILVQKICSPTVISDLILDEHGNYVVQKALFYADQKEKEIILNNIILLTPKIRCTPFGEKLLGRLVQKYPVLNVYIYGNNMPKYMQNLSLENNNNNNNNNYHQKNKKKKGKKKKKNSINNNNNNENGNTNENMFFNNSNPFLNNNNFMNNNINVNNNITINNYNNINNAQNNQNQSKNQNNDKNSINYMNYNNNMINNDYNQNSKYMQRNMNINNETDNKKKGKKKRKNKNKKYNNDANEQYENNVQEEENDNNQDNN